ncbi:hypothetical protein SDC9_147444 [bioreactor metagenome]|uniref:Uncharacterized protein n=1 Tax=bioreactor metagenome TaxID=1076179 RepID=A0A645EFY7_9ZZZZ
MIINEASTGELIESPKRNVSWFKDVPVIPQITREICSFIVKLSLTFIILDIRKNAIKAKLILSRLKPKGLIHIGVNSLDTGIFMAKNVLAIMIKITPFTIGEDRL